MSNVNPKALNSILNDQFYIGIKISQSIIQQPYWLTVGQIEQYTDMQSCCRQMVRDCRNSEDIGFGLNFDLQYRADNSDNPPPIIELAIRFENVTGKKCAQVDQIIKTVLCRQQWNTLQSLTINDQLLTDRQFSYIAKQGKFQYLNQLDLSYCSITKASMRYLKQFTQWKITKQLTLNGNNIGNQGLRYLIQNENINPKMLRLQCCMISGLGMDCLLLRPDCLTNIETLYLSDNAICNFGVWYLVRGNWNKLKQLYLRQAQIGDKGLTNLSKAFWPKLQRLQLCTCKMIQACNKFTSPGLIDLFMSNFPALTYLYIQHNKCSQLIFPHLALSNYKIIQHLDLSFTTNGYRMQYMPCPIYGSLKNINLGIKCGINLIGNMIPETKMKEIRKLFEAEDQDGEMQDDDQNNDDNDEEEMQDEDVNEYFRRRYPRLEVQLG